MLSFTILFRDSIEAYRTHDIIKILHIAQHGSAWSCFIPKFRKINFSTTFYFELGVGIFMKVVDMDVSFHFILVGLHLDFYNLSYN